MKNIIKIMFLCIFSTIYPIEDITIQKRKNSQDTEAKTQSTKKNKFYETIIEALKSKKFFGSIFFGGSLLYKTIEYYTLKLQEDIQGFYLDNPHSFSITELTSMFKSLGKSAHAYLSQTYMLKSLSYEIKDIFNIDPDQIFLVTNNHTMRATGENIIYMPFVEAIDITKKWQFFGSLAHEIKHFKHNHVLIGLLCHYLCFTILLHITYNMIVKKFKHQNDKQLFKKLSLQIQQKVKELQQNNYQNKKQQEITKTILSKIIQYITAMSCLIFFCNWAVSDMTKIIGNFTWGNYFERSADSFTHENPILYKNLLSGFIKRLKDFLSEEPTYKNNRFSFLIKPLYWLSNPHPNTQSRITKLTKILNNIR